MRVTKTIPSIFEGDKGDKGIYLEEEKKSYLFYKYTLVTFVTFKDTGDNVCHLHLSPSNALVTFVTLNFPDLAEFLRCYYCSLENGSCWLDIPVHRRRSGAFWTFWTAFWHVAVQFR